LMDRFDDVTVGSPPAIYTEVKKHLNSVKPVPTSFKEGYHIRLITGNANPKLAQKIAVTLGKQLDPCTVGRFSDGEINIRIENNIRGADVFVIQPVCPPNVHDNFMELLLLTHTLALSSAKRITAVMPYYPYSRQDRKTRPRVPISASAIAQMIEAVGIHRIITLDLHNGQIQGFFHSTPVDNLYAEAEMLRYLQSKNFDKDYLAIVSPDAAGVNRARLAADRIGAASVVTILKRRISPSLEVEMQMAGDVEGFTCVIVDDLINTANTITTAADILKKHGANRVYAFSTHGVFSGPALDKINESCLEEVCVTDSIPQDENLIKCPKLRVSSIVNLLAEAIQRVHGEKSLSVLFE